MPDRTWRTLNSPSSAMYQLRCPAAAAACCMWYKFLVSKLMRRNVLFGIMLCASLIVFCFLIYYESLLPIPDVPERPDVISGRRVRELLEEVDFGDGIKLVPSRLLEKFERRRRLEVAGRETKVFGLRQPALAMVFPDLEPDAMQLEMVSIAQALRAVGYHIEVYAFQDGSGHSIWRTIGMHVNILTMNEDSEIKVDWLNFNGILVNSIAVQPLLKRLLQEPFKSVPVIWTIYEKSLALRQSSYTLNNQSRIINEWKQVFKRATAVVFSTHLLPIMYSSFDAGNYFVIQGFPDEPWESAKTQINRDALRVNMGYNSKDFLIAIVGSQLLYSGMWLEHALVLQALSPLSKNFSYNHTSHSLLKIHILTGQTIGLYKAALEAIAQKFGFPEGSVEQVVVNGSMGNFLSMSDLVIYGSFLEEDSFPPCLRQAMSLGKPIIAPDLAIIRKYVDNRINGYLFPRKNMEMLNKIVEREVVSGKLSLFAQKVAFIGKEHARNLMASERIGGYASLLENIISFSSEFSRPRSISGIPRELKEKWQWHLFEHALHDDNLNRDFKSEKFLDQLEEQWKNSNSNNVNSLKFDEAFLHVPWEEMSAIKMLDDRRRIEEEELKEQTDQPHGNWEELSRLVKRVERAKYDLHERDDMELERTGQPLCIYEPYYGEGSWPFLHHNSLYRGVGLSTKGRRPEADDIDASSRLPLLSNTYYRDLLGESGAFFALANRIDRIHKNAWIGFQSWRAAAREIVLSKEAETSLLEDIQAHRHGDALYFWARMDRDPRNPLRQDFWSFCNAINAGECRTVFAESLLRMYDVGPGINNFPSMPENENTWSVMNCWVLPTRSFLEYVMFLRMFVDALDAQMFDEHHETGYCRLGPNEDPHCYSRILELLINVWAYHSAHRMVYVDPVSGAMQEQHKFQERSGQMWIQWFSFSTLKSMDEDLAEEYDSDDTGRRWLWPFTGEIFWQGVYERERNRRQQEKETRKQQSRDKIKRIKKRAHQKTLGKYIKPPAEAATNSNSVTASV